MTDPTHSTNAISVIVNDQPHSLPVGANILALLSVLDLPSTRVAVEVNKILVRRAEHATHILSDADVIEIMTLVGGG